LPYIVGALLWGVATTPSASIETTYAEHTRAVALARAGEHTQGLAILRELLARFPDDYPLNRDAILVATWAGDCAYALERYAYIRTRPQLDAYLVTPLANCAVERARAGDYDTARGVLAGLQPHAADPYPLQRDAALIAAWSGDCRRALNEFGPIRNAERNEPYLTVPMADCMVREGRSDEAEALVVNALEHRPEDDALHQALLGAQVANRLAGGDWHATVLEGGVSTDDAEPGPREWRGVLLARTGVTPSVRMQARLLGRAASGDRGSGSGDLRRVGLGVGWRPNPQWEFLQEISTDIRTANQGGATTRLDYRPLPEWSFSALHATFADDLPLRARTNGIEADRAEIAGAYHSRDYVWDGRASADRYDFSDGNRRTSAYATLGYAYDMLPEREQRIYLEAYGSRNSLDAAPYFNPRSDSSLGVVHRTTFVIDSRYKRHVDSLYLWIASYRQEGFDAKPRWGVKYEQDYDFDDDLALVAGISLMRNVYDGEYENAIRGEIYFRRRF